MSEAASNDREHSELLLLYNTSVAEIASFKQQQWSVTYYVLAVQAALAAAAQAILGATQSDRFLLGALVAVSLALGLTVLRTLQVSIELRRTRLCKTRQHFSEAFKDARSGSKEPDPVAVVLAITQVVGAIVAGWLVVCRL